MSEAAASMASKAIGTTATAYGLALVAGGLGGLLMMALDPPKTRGGMFLQALVALSMSGMLGPLAVQALDFYLPWIDLNTATPSEVLSVAAPVYGLVGAMSWGLASAMLHVRRLLGSRAASDAFARKLGVTEDSPKP